MFRLKACSLALVLAAFTLLPSGRALGQEDDTLAALERHIRRHQAELRRKLAHLQQLDADHQQATFAGRSDVASEIAAHYARHVPEAQQQQQHIGELFQQAVQMRGSGDEEAPPVSAAGDTQPMPPDPLAGMSGDTRAMYDYTQSVVKGAMNMYTQLTGETTLPDVNTATAQGTQAIVEEARKLASGDRDALERARRMAPAQERWINFMQGYNNVARVNLSIQQQNQARRWDQDARDYERKASEVEDRNPREAERLRTQAAESRDAAERLRAGR